MQADALIVPFFCRNTEESRWNPIHAFWHSIHGYVPFDWLQAAQIPILTKAVYTVGMLLWFVASFVQVPIPVRTTLIFGSPVPYDPEENVDDVVQRSHDALQALIRKHQPNALEGRNYRRALAERWQEWRLIKPTLIRRIESFTPTAVKRWFRDGAHSSAAIGTTRKAK
jgi:hypothetical protein